VCVPVNLARMVFNSDVLSNEKWRPYQVVHGVDTSSIVMYLWCCFCIIPHTFWFCTCISYFCQWLWRSHVGARDGPSLSAGRCQALRTVRSSGTTNRCSAGRATATPFFFALAARPTIRIAMFPGPITIRDISAISLIFWNLVQVPTSHLLWYFYCCIWARFYICI